MRRGEDSKEGRRGEEGGERRREWRIVKEERMRGRVEGGEGGRANGRRGV